MGLTSKSTGTSLLGRFEKGKGKTVIALAGSPNVGKSTVFNALTGLNQHTGNWTGKTVSTAIGQVNHKTEAVLLADVPGTYSLCARSAEEEAARDFICFGGCDGVIVVCDALCLERNLSLVLQISEFTPKVTVCVNQLDRAKKKGQVLNLEKLSEKLKLEVCGCSAKKKKGLCDLMDKTLLSIQRSSSPLHITYPAEIENALSIIVPPLENLCGKDFPARFTALKILCGEEEFAKKLASHEGYDIFSDSDIKNALTEARTLLLNCGLHRNDVNDMISATISRLSSKICKECLSVKTSSYGKADRIADSILTGKFTAFPIMLLMLAAVFYITISGANYPSAILSDILFSLQDKLFSFLLWLKLPEQLCSMLVFGVYRVVAWVVSVMLPPMAIFFPMFTLLEDCGALPRIAYNLDKCFQACKACGKQALTMCMSFGCNAAGVVGCRIIDSPRERLIAILTSGFMPCNGKFPMLISIIGMLFVFSGGSNAGNLYSALMLAFLIVLSVILTLIASFILSKTVLKGKPSAFVLELPSYKCPDFGKVIVRSFLDRTLFVLGRAVIAAAPAGLIIWLFANITVGELSLLSICTGFLDPFGRLFGMDGVIIMAFILGLPANEIVVPVMIMAYMSGSTLTEMGSSQLFTLFASNGWTFSTALCTAVFAMLHWPCATTLLTVKKETGSKKMTALAAILPTVFGLVLCFITNILCNVF